MSTNPNKTQRMAMAYETLKPPEHGDLGESDDDSIQGTPLLETGAMFSQNAPVPLHTSGQVPYSMTESFEEPLTYHQDETYDGTYDTQDYYDRRSDSPYLAVEDSPYEQSTFQPAESPYLNNKYENRSIPESYEGIAYSQSPYGAQHSHLLPESHGFPTLSGHRTGYTTVARSPTRSPERSGRLTPVLEPENSFNEEHLQTAPYSPEQNPCSPNYKESSKNSPKHKASNYKDNGLTSPMAYSAPHEHLQFSRKRRQQGFNLSEPISTASMSTASAPTASAPTASVPSTSAPTASLPPASTPATPKTIPTETHRGKLKSAPPAAAVTGEDDEDALPFETTKRLAMAGQADDAQYASPNRGVVKSSENFESYRRSIMETELLTRKDSIVCSPTRYNSVKHKKKDEEDDVDADVDGDVEGELDEKELKRKSARQRQEQDARMSIYRQSMMKIMGNTLYSGTTPAGDAESISSARAIDDRSVTRDYCEGEGGELMDDIPLSILQAHRFPKAQPRPKSLNSLSVTDDRSLRSNTSPRPMSIASSRMLPNNDTYKQPPPAALPNVFGKKDAMLSRGLIGEINRETDHRKKRQTYGYGNNTNTPLGNLKESGALQEKLDLVIEMLTKLAPDGHDPRSAPVPMHPPSQRAPSIRSFQYSEPNPMMVNPMMNPMYSMYGMPLMSPMPGMMPMNGSMSHLNGPSAMNGINSMGGPNGMSSANGANNINGQTTEHNVSNRPSRMRIIKKDDDDDDDDDELEKLRERRENLKMKWMQKEVSTVPEEPTDIESLAIETNEE